MSSALLLEALRKHELQEYYPRLTNQGLINVDKIAQLTETEYSRLGVRSSEDKLKFLRVAQDMKEMIRRKAALSAPPPPSPMRKRPAPIVNSRLSPDNKKARRMTIAPGSMIPKQLPPSTPGMTAFDRRRSYVPSAPINNRRQSFYRSPTRPVQSKLSSPQRPRITSTIKQEPKSPQKLRLTSTTRTTINEEPSFDFTKELKQASPQRQKPKPVIIQENIVEIPKEPIEEKPSSRHLDAYGIPVQNPRKSVVTPERQSVTLEEFLAQKPKSTPAKAPLVSSSIQTPVYNELHQRIRVCVRKRPLSKRESGNQELDIAPLVGSRTIQLNAPKTRIDLTRYTEKHTFTFDDTFDSNTSNTQIYARTAKPLVEYVFSGGNATCFAYGQTGSGKTYTMLDPEHGLYVLAAHDIFRMLSSPSYSHLTASVGFYEIYQGQLFDLLNQKAKLNAREDGNRTVIIAGLREVSIDTVDSLLQVFEYGNSSRTVGKTGANNKSSRSHAVLQILLRAKNGSSNVHGKLNFIDLAGSERGADRGDANQKTRQEGAEINKSLLALKECIRAIDQGKNHTPFRGSKLTQVLRDSFIGDGRTCMIATISPNNSNSEHTLNTLRYADRVKQFRGESDPRLLGDQGSRVVQLAETADDSQSLTNSDSFLEDVSENILDVDIPNEVSSNALATPTNDRYYNAHIETTPHRQAKYMKRLESPPADMFDDHKMEDPFFSKPVDPDPSPLRPSYMSSSPIRSSLVNNNNTEDMMSVTSTPTRPNSGVKSAPALDMQRVKRFMRLHKAQIKQMEECIRKEKDMVDRLSLTVSSRESREEDEVDDIEDEQTKLEYETYLNDLEDIMDTKASFMKAVTQKIKQELKEEEEEEEES